MADEVTAMIPPAALYEATEEEANANLRGDAAPGVGVAVGGSGGGGDGGATGFPLQLPLSPNLMRNLGDRSYDKRKNAAMELENLIKQLQENAATFDSANPSIDGQSNTNLSRQRIPAIIELLGNDFACSTNANHRKGGLIGLAATAIGLMHEAHFYLDKLLPPVLHCFDDPESRVRYYACESLYNIAKVSRGHILQYFNQIFDGLCKLFADVDVDVKNGANLLDRLVKDIVTESEYFDVDMFIPLLHKYIRMTNPYIRQLLVGWITVLDSVPDIDMLDWLPEFLDGLFNMLSDGNREIRQAADSALAEFLREIKQKEEFIDFTFKKMVDILVHQCHSKERFNRLTAISWVHEFVILGKEKLVDLYGDLLGAIMYCISDAEHEIRQVAERANDDLLQLVNKTHEEIDQKELILPIMEKLIDELKKNDHVPTRMASLRWISMLLEKKTTMMEIFSSHNKIMINNNNSSNVTQIPTRESNLFLLPTLLQTLSDASDTVVLLNLEVLAKFSLLNEKKEIEKVLHAIVLLFAKNRRLLETRGSLIIRKLCILLDAKTIYMIFAKVISSEEEKEKKKEKKKDEEDKEKEDEQFASIMVQTLNLILLTANEVEDLRQSLRKSFQKENATKEDIQVFTVLFECWCYNPIAVFSLCLLAQSYSLSSALITKFAEIDATVGFLMQIDKLVQLLESPIFIHMRLQLLEFQEEYHTDLVKSLYGLLMLLPQSAAFRILRDRLASVSNMAATIPRLENISSSHSNSSGGLSLSNKFSKDNKNKSKMTVDTSSIFVDQLALLRHFDMIVVQKKTII